MARAGRCLSLALYIANGDFIVLNVDGFTGKILPMHRTRALLAKDVKYEQVVRRGGSGGGRMSHLRMSAADVEAINARNKPRTVKLIQDDERRGRKPGRIKGSTRQIKEAKYPTEHVEQVTLINWWRDNCKTFGLDERVLFCIPNSSRLSGGGRIYKWAEGLRSGVPDLILAVLRVNMAMTKMTAGLFIEMKRIKSGKVSDEQAAYHTLLRAQGYAVEVCYGAEEAKAAIKRYLGVLAISGAG